MGNRLLLADDSITIQKVVAIIFANEEFELTVVDNGVAALEKAREIRPDVMLVDALMPGKTGYEVCAEIRRDPKLSSVPILLLIGAFEPPDEEKARECGADASISKPFESQQLIDRVKELLELGKTRSIAPAATQSPIESTAEELWGDLSSFDTMSPAAAPAGLAAPASPAPIAPAPVPPAAPAPIFSAPKEQVTAAPAAYHEEIVEASYEDDLWGAFDLEEAPLVAAPPRFSGEADAGSEFEAEEFFSFEDESEAIEETGPAIDLPYAVDEPLVEPFTEEMVSFAGEPAAEPEPSQFYEPSSPASVSPLEPQSVPPAQATTAEAGSKAEPVTFALSEADLTAAIARISKEVIERIVWEVVPDLAEVLIKEEIRKLKAGIRG